MSERPIELSRLSPRIRRLTVASVAALFTLVLSGCTPEMRRGFLPGYEDGPVTNQTDRITNLWVGSWVAALIVGAIVWGLVIWCVIVYRKRRNDQKLPVQIRFHLPLEITYLVIPMIMVGTLFYFTARDIEEITDTSATPDLFVQVIAKQWAWDVNYLGPSIAEEEDDVWYSSEHIIDVSVPGQIEDYPKIVLPVDARVEFILNSRDVIHSFWVPAMLFKLDMFPGNQTNSFQVELLREGVYAGKCAELCGEFHSNMLFNLEVVSQEDYEAYLESLREAGQSGTRGLEYSRQQAAVESVVEANN